MKILILSSMILIFSDLTIVTQGNGDEVILSKDDIERIEKCDCNRIVIHTSDRTIDLRFDEIEGVRVDE